MRNIVIFSDDHYYSFGLSFLLRQQYFNVFVCRCISDVKSIPFNYISLYIVSVKDEKLREYTCQIVGDSKNVLHFFDMPEDEISNIPLGYLSRRLCLKQTRDGINRYLKNSFQPKVKISPVEIKIIRALIENESGIDNLARRVNLSEKSLQSRKYHILKKMGFRTTHPVNLRHCHTLLCFRYGILRHL